MEVIDQLVLDAFNAGKKTLIVEKTDKFNPGQIVLYKGEKFKIIEVTVGSRDRMGLIIDKR